MPNLGDTFRFDLEGAHLWIVITTPEGADGRFIMVNITTLRPNAPDTSCVLQVGDHPFIVRDSIAFYHDAREWWTTSDHGYDHLFAKGDLIPQAPMIPAVLRRIQDGALASHFFKRKYEPRVQACLVW